MNEILNKIGRFRIHRGFIMSYPDDLLEVMGKMIITRAELMFAPDCFEYMAVSELFEPVERGVDPPSYTIWITRDEDESEITKIEAKKIEPIETMSSNFDPGNPIPLDHYWDILRMRGD